MRIKVASLLACVVVAAVGLSSPAGAAQHRYPVPYSFLTTFVPNGAWSAVHRDADPPGANDWTCKPSAVHPRPVVLVHGTFANKYDNWPTFAPLLANNGYCVYALNYGVLPTAKWPLNLMGGLDRIETSAQQLSAFVDKVLAATGASKVDIVGHSQGTFMPDYYARFLGGAHKIDKYVSLAPLWHGTNALGMASFAQLAKRLGLPPPSYGMPAIPEMAAGSDFVAKLRSGGGPAVPGISYTNIITKYDELVVPYTSGIEPGMRNIVVQDQCPIDFTEHGQIAADRVAAADVLNALDPAHPRPVPCVLVLPGLGP